MKQYIIQFSFEGENYHADVTEIDGLDDVQFSVSPKNEQLAGRFHTNLFERVKQDNTWHYDFPDTANGEAYMQAVVAGLERYLG
jgi:Zn-dependent oligopeptidase